jgi:hypothetical protein
VTSNSTKDIREANAFNWRLKIKVDGGNRRADGENHDVQLEEIQLSIEKNGDKKWEMDVRHVDAALSLWIYHIRKGAPNSLDRLRTENSLMQKIGRVIGCPTRDIDWWIGHFEDSTALVARDDGTAQKTTPRADGSGESTSSSKATNKGRQTKNPQKQKPFGPIGFLGLESKETNGNLSWC